MVLYKYCPKCYSLNVGMDHATGGQKCRQCGYVGAMSQDSIDKINVMKKSKDSQRYAAATSSASSARPTLKSVGPENDCEIIRKDDPYNDEIEKIEVADKQHVDEDDKVDVDNLEARQSNLMKRTATQQSMPQMHGMRHKSGLTAKERLKGKSDGKDWDLL